MFDDARWGDDPRHLDDARDRDAVDPRDALLEHVNLPRGPERELVHDRDREYDLRESESRTLSIVGAFRVVSSRDLLDHDGRQVNARRGDLRHLREEGLVHTVPLDGHRDVAVVLTERGRDLLESHRRDRDAGQDWDGGRDRDSRQQAFYAELKKPREIEHDAQVYRAYVQAADRLHERGATVERVVLDYELKREYQRFLQEPNRGRRDSDGRPHRDPSEIDEWARARDLPCADGHVQFPDARIEYREEDGRRDHEDIEVVTIHYRGSHGAAAARSGFRCFGGSSARTGARGGSRGPHLADELLR